MHLETRRIRHTLLISKKFPKGAQVTNSRSIRHAGPILHFRGHDEGALRLALLTVQPAGDPAPADVETATGQAQPQHLTRQAGLDLWRHDFRLTGDERGYRLAGRDYAVTTRLDGDLRIAFVSCNGEESGDLDRDAAERNLMWDRLAADHADRPFALLLQGGDQIYADEATQGHPLTQHWPDKVPPCPDPAALDDLRAHLRDRFAQRYMQVLSAQASAGLLATVPALSIWDDHDICDGWGSLPPDITHSEVGRVLFEIAREAYLLFQHAATEADIPQLFWDRTGSNLGWRRDLPGLTIFAPDLRSERERRQVMGEAGWRAVEAFETDADHVMMVSSVPLLGPRLSLLESVMNFIPKMQHYEDDLRDQWQSHTHRDAWRRMLRQVLRLRAKAPVTVVSGEIHLATRAEMGPEATLVHQLVASGISHRAPPQLYARSLGALAGLGEAPLENHSIRIHPLPGQRHRYMAERNYLTLERQANRWSARWSLEDSGVTPPLALD